MNAQTQLCTGGIKSFIKGFTSVLQAKLLKANNDLEPDLPSWKGPTGIKSNSWPQESHHGHFTPDINPHRHFHELSQAWDRVILF